MRTLTVVLALVIPGCFLPDYDADREGSGGESGGKDGGAAGPSGGGMPGVGGMPGGGPVAGGGGNAEGENSDCAFPDDLTIELIDDMEPPDTVVEQGGGWVAYNGKDIEVDGAFPDMAQRPDGDGHAINYRTNVLGTDGTAAWHQFGFAIKNDGSAFDASVYDGIILCAMAADSGADFPTLTLQVLEDDGTLGGREYTSRTTASVPAKWAMMKLPFDSSWQFREKLREVKFLGAFLQEYDIWIDDVAFYMDK